MNTVNDIWIVIRKEWREQQSKSFRRTLLGFPLLLIFLVFMVARDLPKDFLKTFLGLPMKSIVLGATIMVEGMLAGPIFNTEKVSRSIESLLSTPLGLSHILAGKAGMASMTGTMVACICGAGATAIINLQLPARTVIWPPADTPIFIAIIVPATAFAFSAFIGLVLMLGVPLSVVNGMATLVAMALMAFASRLSALANNGWVVDAAFAGMSLLILGVDFSLYHSLTNERVVTGAKPTIRCL